VTDTETQLIPNVIADDALRLQDAPRPELYLKHKHRHLPKWVIFTWEVCPPSLPSGAKEQFRETGQEEIAKDGTPKKVAKKTSFDP
jgi:hypothetical protein